ncbi:MAG: hypothetical protein JSW67_06840 [Candidatus Latescibacterota bacterium]|nr:MAG: hypothetical protein JSW67_06840 [Candidatus Latescibacterota bacterium]
MSVEMFRSALGWCTLINWAFLLGWWIWVTLAHDWTYRVHAKWFKISEERFDEIHYKGMGALKVGTIVFNLTPYLALRIVV